MHAKSKEDDVLEEYRHIDPNKIPKEQGIYQEFDIDTDITVDTIAQRVVENREKYKAKYDKKMAQQDKYYAEDKQYVAEL